MTTYNEAQSAIFSWYYPHVRMLVDEAIEACKAERPAGVAVTEFLSNWVDEVSECNLTIYNGPASMVLAASNNDDAYYDEFNDHASTSWRAQYALRADMWEALNARKAEWDV